MASFRDLSDIKSREAYEKLMGLFDRRKIAFSGKRFEAPVAGEALADFVFTNGKPANV